VNTSSGSSALMRRARRRARAARRPLGEHVHAREARLAQVHAAAADREGEPVRRLVLVQVAGVGPGEAQLGETWPVSAAAIRACAVARSRRVPLGSLRPATSADATSTAPRGAGSSAATSAR